MVVDGVFEVIGFGGFFQIGDGKNGGAEDLLGLGTFFWRHAQMTCEFEINDGDNRNQRWFPVISVYLVQNTIGICRRSRPNKMKQKRSSISIGLEKPNSE